MKGLRDLLYSLFFHSSKYDISCVASDALRYERSFIKKEIHKNFEKISELSYFLLH